MASLSARPPRISTPKRAARWSSLSRPRASKRTTAPSARRRANSRWSAMVEARTNVAVGDTLPELVRGPIDRATLALFAGASHDHVRLHIDSDFDNADGMGDVLAPGMMSMDWLARRLTHWAP